MRTIGLITIILYLSGCGALKTWQASSDDYKKLDAITTAPFYNDDYSQAIATRFGLMALFSELVYMRQLGEDRSGINECTVGGKIVDDSFYTPPLLPHLTIEGGAWSKWRPDNKEEVSACFNSEGLFYDTFVFTDKHGDIIEAVIAFRGTENRKGEMFKDWKSNISAFFGFEPTQYKLARELIPNLITALIQDNPGIRIYTTGHSLGGGLAQQAGFLSRDVSAVVTFNTSPVTNWTYLRLKKLVDNEYPTIYRLYHGGEALEKVRFITSNATSAQYGRHDIGVQYQPRSDFTGHSMEIFTCAFAKLIASRDDKGDVADHYYEPDYITKELLAEGRMCFGIDNGVVLK